jgi:hypothetical protein
LVKTSKSDFSTIITVISNYHKDINLILDLMEKKGCEFSPAIHKSGMKTREMSSIDEIP